MVLAEPIDSSLSSNRRIRFGRIASDKVGSAERQRPLQRPPESKFGPETERNESGKVGTAGKGNAKAKNWKAKQQEPASAGNRTRKSLIE
ncbi:hypothetical protein ABZ424_20265, partial [Streptomyces sp. NPDC005790]|uniref:hypothetical protein n=1 Tax=Streptomyces sp. NPDC005790 TaxID=3154777 RepID=UPI0033F187EA